MTRSSVPSPLVFFGLVVGLASVCGCLSGNSAGSGNPFTKGGAGGSGGSTTGTGGAAPGTGGAAEACPGGASFDYVVRSLVTHEPAVMNGVATVGYGFDLDGRVSDGSLPEDCGLPDFVAADGRPGADNAIEGLWAEDFSSLFKHGILSGWALTLVRLNGVDSFDHDDCIDVSWSRAFVPSGGAPELDATGRPAAGQNLFAESNRRQFRRARIEAGMVEAEGGDTIDIGAFDVVLPGSTRAVDPLFPLAQTRIALRASPETLTNGMLGGQLIPAHLVKVYSSVYHNFPDVESEVERLLRPDLPSNGQRCVLLSAGFGFDAVRVTIVQP